MLDDKFTFRELHPGASNVLIRKPSDGSICIEMFSSVFGLKQRVSLSGPARDSQAVDGINPKENFFPS